MLPETNPCECGCGENAGTYAWTKRSQGHVRGEPRRFINHHNGRTLRAIDRLWGYVEKTDACWLWTGRRNDQGYGLIPVDARVERAHRVTYTLLVGPIPDGLELDHLCRVRACVNPAHLEPVTHRENLRRGLYGTGHLFGGAAQSRKTHCPKGHSYSGDNLHIARNSRNGRPSRMCRTCHRDRERERKRRLRA